MKKFESNSLPIFYSLQNCPYAMRARMGLLMAKKEVMLRAIVTTNKPQEMLRISPKGTVPIIVFKDESVIEESLEIMIWALEQNDPEDLLYKEDSGKLFKILKLIHECDHSFRTNLSAYKYNKRYHLSEEINLRTKCEVFINKLELLLLENDYFLGSKLSLADLAILPFIRQFASVDKKWFREAGYPKLTNWLSNNMQSMLFSKTMKEYPLWLDSGQEFLFSWNS